MLLWETGDFEGVVTQTDAVLQARPLDPMATLMSARGMEMLGRFDEARTRLETLQSADLAPQQAARLRLALDANALSHEISETGSVDAVVRLADLYLRHGEVLEAVEVLESPAAETDSMAVLDRLAYLYIRMHLVDDAEATAGRILALEPGRPEGHYYLAQVHLARDDLSGAEREFLAISEPAGRNASAWFLGAVIFQLQGREDDAFRALEQAVVLGGQDILRQAGGHPALATSRALERVLGASSGAR